MRPSASAFEKQLCLGKKMRCLKNLYLDSLSPMTMQFDMNQKSVKDTLTRPDRRHKMRQVCVLFAFENNMGPTDRRTDTTIYRDATAHLKMISKCKKIDGKS